MLSPLSTERKYNIRYYHYLVSAYILLAVMFIFVFKVLFAFIRSDGEILWSVILLLYILFFSIIFHFLNLEYEKNDKSYGVGFEAEYIVGEKLLSSLGNDYLVIHDIQKGRKRGNIDHVVVGPTGIFAIETKANKSPMIYYPRNVGELSYQAQKFMTQTAGNALWIHNIIKEKTGIDVFVYGVVARPFNKNNKIETYCKNRVCIMDGDTVCEHIKNFNGRLSNSEINKIYSLLCEQKRVNDKLNQTVIQRKLAIFF